MKFIEKSLAQKLSYNFWCKHNSEKGYPEKYPEEEVVRFLSSFNNKDSNILDLASGSGKNTSVCLDKGFRTHCVDYSKPGLVYTLKKNKKSKNLKTYCVDITKNRLPFKNKFFDRIIATQIVDHILKEDINFVLSEMKRVLKKEGKILLNLMSTETTKRSRLGVKILGEKNTYLTNKGNSAGEIHSLFTINDMNKMFKNKFKVLSSLHVQVKNDQSKEKTVFKYFYLTN